MQAHGPRSRGSQRHAARARNWLTIGPAIDHCRLPFIQVGQRLAGGLHVAKVEVSEVAGPHLADDDDWSGWAASRHNRQQGCNRVTREGPDTTPKAHETDEADNFRHTQNNVLY